MGYQKSFLKWAGGKYGCLHEIIPQFPMHAKRFLEPFVGSASVFINTRFSQTILADINLDLVQLYDLIKTDAKEFIPYCKQYFVPENNHAEQYYALRRQFNESQSNLERSALFLYLNKHGYNGLCRYNQKGIYNVPFGFYKRPYFPEKEMHYFHQKSASAEFLHAGYQTTFNLAEPGDLIYCDPPYVPLSKTAKFTTYAREGFTTDDQQKLAQLASDARSKNITVIISNHDTPLTREYYKDAEIISFSVKRYISCKVTERYPVRELLAVFR